MSEKPICLYCGKPLRKTSMSCEREPGAPPPKEVNGQAVIQILGRKKLSYRTDAERVSVWCGKWGGYGDNLFCGLNCGYRWAVMAVNLNEQQDPGYVTRIRGNMKKFAEARR